MTNELRCKERERERERLAVNRGERAPRRFKLTAERTVSQIMVDNMTAPMV